MCDDHTLLVPECFVLAISVLANIVETVPCGSDRRSGLKVTCGERFGVELFCLDTASVAIFTAEYLLRLYAAPRRCHYISSAALRRVAVPGDVKVSPPNFSSRLRSGG